jgi:hypothetical protein
MAWRRRVPFDVRQLRYAIAAGDHGSFYRAARALEIEKSTLSRAIIKLGRLLINKVCERARRMSVIRPIADPIRTSPQVRKGPKGDMPPFQSTSLGLANLSQVHFPS